MIMATRIHLFPFRTQKLSSALPKVLSHPRLGRIASCRISKKRNRNHKLRLRLFFGFQKSAIATISCDCVFFLQLAIRHGRPNEAFHRTVDTHCPCRSEMSEDIRPVRAVTEPPCFHLNGGEKASCRISIKNDRFQAENGHFFYVLTIPPSASYWFNMLNFNQVLLSDSAY